MGRTSHKRESYPEIFSQGTTAVFSASPHKCTRRIPDSSRPIRNLYANHSERWQVNFLVVINIGHVAKQPVSRNLPARIIQTGFGKKVDDP